MIESPKKKPEQPDASTPHTFESFTSLDEFSDWMDKELLVLEEKYRSYQTKDSIKQSFARR